MTRLSVLSVLALLASPSVASAHARLVWPTPRSNNDANKTSPCGLDTTPVGTPTELVAGSQIEVRFEETINHPGWFRVAYAPSNDVGFDQNVLLDNIPHSNVGIASRTNPRPYTSMVTVPSTPCTRCTLQLIQVMTDRQPPDDKYYSCADVRIVAAPGGDAGTPAPDAAPTGDGGVIDGGPQLDSGRPIDGGGVDGGGAIDAARLDAGVAPAPDAGIGAAQDAAPPPPPAVDAGALAPSPDAGPARAGSIGDTSVGCRCTSPRSTGGAWLALLLGIGARRRKSISRIRGQTP